jgi:methylated-DNA-[protein]-cysteine S-methyltransferase
MRRPARHLTPTQVAYEAEGWGVGEMWLDGDRLLLHELPRPGVESAGGTHRLAGRIIDYFAGKVDDFLDVEVDLEGATDFEQTITDVLRRVPRGETVTYGELAALAGHPNAQRAAGTFCARNRFAIVVPCHRVVAADGLGSYGSLGTRYKRRLLELEGVSV